jgi:carbamate kinase
MVSRDVWIRPSENMENLIVLALGGNALLKEGEEPLFKVQVHNAEVTMRGIARAVAGSGSRFIITHGNGPQVGDELLRNFYAEKEVPKLPMHILNAETQALIGSMIELALNRELERLGSKRRFSTIITHVLVSEKDPAFKNPSKPVGPYYSEKELKAELKREKFTYVKVRGRCRRTIASPRPLQILEVNSIKALLDAGYCVICCGGGGVPVFKRGKNYVGAEAVIDKDRTAQLLASQLHAKELDILTDVSNVYWDMDDKSSKIVKVSSKKIRAKLQSFEVGTMRPKLEACTSFIDHGGTVARIGGLYMASDVLKGRSGTTIVK